MDKKIIIAVANGSSGKDSHFLAYGDSVADATDNLINCLNWVYNREYEYQTSENVSDGFASLVSEEELTNKFLLTSEKVVEITEEEARDISEAQYEIETCDSKEEQEKIRALNIPLNKRETAEAKGEEWNKEVDVWFKLYMDFNDNNFRHADQCFESNRFYEKTTEELHELNLHFVLDILNAYRGNAYDMLKDAKYAEPYLEEAIKKGLAYAEEKDSKTITIPSDMVEKIREFCDDELDWHINECEPEEYADECEAEIFLLRSLGFTDLADEYENLYKAAVEED